MKVTRHLRLRVLGMVAVLAMFGASCGDDSATPTDDPTDSADTDTGSDSDSDSGDSDTGDSDGESADSITIGVFAESQGLDPIIQSSTGLAGGMENAAIYDVLMRWIPETGEYEPHVAESLTANDDFTEWTLALRPEVEFSDGTPLTADAVIASINRHIENNSRTAGLVTPIASMEATDDHTVVFGFESPFASLPFSLASAPGMIVNPAAVEAMGEDFPTNPQGAGVGPYVIDSFLPNEAVTLTANPDYWGGAPAIGELRFVFVAGASATYETFKSGQFQAAFLRDDAAINQARDDGFDGFEAVYSAGGVILMNNGVRVTCTGEAEDAAICEGEEAGATPRVESIANDLRIRQAVAAAINLDTLNERAFEGAGRMSTSLIHEESSWFNGIEGPQYDLDLATQLVDEVKAEGWDGTIRIACHDGLPAWGTAVGAMLEAAGFAPVIEDQRDIQANISAIIVQKDFDLACWGLTIADEAPLFAMNRDFNPALNGLGGNFGGYENDEVGALLAGASSAGPDEIQAIVDGIATAYTEDVPLLSLQATSDFILMNPDLDGAELTVGSVVLFDDATFAG
ncbi:MAG: ABC transporter substrate-binding protein [Acidimicrobiales bacterium]